MLISSDALNNGPVKWVYMNMLSTGPVWLFIFLGVVTALLPDLLVGVWEAYAAGEGVLVNQVMFLSRYFFVLNKSRKILRSNLIREAIDNQTLPMTLSDGHRGNH